ncbi:MAG: hypothetical protein ACI8WA_000028 [Polaribacter sp.]|jgi:hypothetical protein
MLKKFIQIIKAEHTTTVWYGEIGILKKNDRTNIKYNIL